MSWFSQLIGIDIDLRGAWKRLRKGDVTGAKAAVRDELGKLTKEQIELIRDVAGDLIRKL